MKKFLKNYWFILCMLAGIVAGCLVGAFAPSFGSKIEFLGTLFINMMFCVVVPMVFCSIASAIANMKSVKRAGKIMGVTIATFLVTAAIAGVLMYIVCRIFPLVDGHYTIVEGEVGEALGFGDMIVNFFTKPDFAELLSRRAILPLIVAAVLALLCGIAYAVIMQGQAWYYNNRFTAYQEHEPQKHQAIMDNLQIVTRQEQTEGTPVRVTVQDAAWVPQEKLLTVSLRAVEADPQTQELHPMWNLDPDGSYVGDDAEALAEDEEARSEHWLLTEKGFGPVREMMSDGTKELLLFEADEVLLGTPDNAVEILGNGSSMDSFVGEDGAVITVLKMELPWIDEGYEAQVMAHEGMEEAQKERLVTQARAAREALSAQNGGELSLCVPYEVSTYVEGDDAALYSGGVKGWVSFRIRVEETAQ